IVLRDLEAAYARAVRGDTRQPGELDVRYRDFAVWHRSRIDGPDLESDRQYWREALQNAPHVVELPADYPRAARPSFAGATHRFVLPRPLVERLRALGRAHGSTLFMTLLAGFAGVVARWTGRDDLVIGTPESGRSRVEIEPLVGCFFNTLPIRMDLSGAPSFLEFLQRVRRASLDSYA